MRILLLALFFLLLIEDDTYQPTTFVFPAYKHTYGIRKAGPTELFLFMGFRVNFRDPQGLACVRLDAWEDPDDPHDNDELTVYGVNSGQNNIIYNKSMWSLGVYGNDEEPEKSLNKPHGICANSRGDVYVADTGNHRIVRLFNPAHDLQYQTSIGVKGQKEGQFLFPKQVVLDNSGNIFVSDSGNHRIQVFDSTNSFYFSFSGNGYLQGPNGITITDEFEKQTHTKGSFLIVIDSVNSRINKFDLKGNLLKAISIYDLGFSRVKMEYICLDYYNHLLITDSENHCIHKFNKNLDYITSFGRRGDDDNEFIRPKGITIYRYFGQLFVAENSGAQYFWVGTDIMDFKFHSDNDRIIFTFKLTEPSYLTADIFDMEERFVMRLANRRLLTNAGKHFIRWNGIIGNTNKKILEKDDLQLSDQYTPGKMAPSGKYRIKLSLEATYSSRTHFVREEEIEFEFSNKQD